MRKRYRLDGKQIEIGGLIYTIRYRKGRKLIKKGKLAIRGEIDFHNRVIEIEKGMAPSEELEVLVHEIGHAVLDTFIPAEMLDKYTAIEEMIIEPYSRLLVGALRSAKLLKED